MTEVVQCSAVPAQAKIVFERDSDEKVCTEHTNDNFLRRACKNRPFDVIKLEIEHIQRTRTSQLLITKRD